MKAQLFIIRLAPEYLSDDQDQLNEFLDSVTLKDSAVQFLEEQSQWSVLILYDVAPSKKRKQQLEEIIDLSEHQQLTYENLRLWRNDKANKEGIKCFMICHNTELMEVAARHPNTLEELQQIKGFRKYKVEKYGKDILSVLNACS